MPDSNIKKISIAQVDLPPMSVEKEGYILRYRIASEDKNRFSHWSPINIVVPDYTFVSGNLVFNKAGSIASLAWDAVHILKDGNPVRYAHEYDIWLRWDRNDSGDWLYQERIDSTNLSVLVPSTYKINGVIQESAPNRLAVEIFLKGSPITRDSSFLRVYQQTGYTV